MSTILRRYTFKLYPNKAQETALHQQRVMCCQLWNALLQMREEHYRRDLQKAKEDRRTPTAFDQAKEITKLRAACPEWGHMNASSQAEVARMLEAAFKAFFRRAKAGAGASSGYPRYRAAKLWETIPFREMGKGWKFEYGRCAAGAQAQSGTHPKACSDIAGGQPENAGHPQERGDGLGHNPGGHPEDVGYPHPSGGRLYVKGIPSLIRARGKLPRDPVSWRNANILFRDGLWWLSVCVEMEPARAAGADSLKIKFDLLDQFARVERADGAMSAPRESANQTQVQGVTIHSGADALEMGSGDRLNIHKSTLLCGADALEMGSGDRASVGVEPTMIGADALEMGSSISASNQAQEALLRAFRLEKLADAVKSERDTRRKRRSWRWMQGVKRAASLKAKAARIRREALHLFSSQVVGSASCLEVVAPPAREVTKSARGSKSEWGAAVALNAELNRNTLNQAPGLAVQMLTYKAAEAAIPFVLVRDETPATTVGQDISVATKVARKARRNLKKEISA